MNTNESILIKVKNSAFFKKIEDEEKSEILIKRKEAAQALADLEKDIEPSLSAQRLIKAAEMDLKKARALVKKKRNALNVAAVKSWELSNARTLISNKNEIFLKNSYDPKIDRAISFFEKRERFIRGIDPTIFCIGKKFNVHLFKKKPVTKSNAPEIEKMFNYCRDAINQLKEMRLEPVCDVERIDKLRAGLPEKHLLVNMLRQEKPLKRVVMEPSRLVRSDF